MRENVDCQQVAKSLQQLDAVLECSAALHGILLSPAIMTAHVRKHVHNILVPCSCRSHTFADAVTSLMLVRLSSKKAKGFFTSTNGSLPPKSSRLGLRQLR